MRTHRCADTHKLNKPNYKPETPTRDELFQSYQQQSLTKSTYGSWNVTG